MSRLQSSPDQANFKKPISGEYIFQMAFNLPQPQFDRISCYEWQPVNDELDPIAKHAKNNAPACADSANLPADVLVFEADGNLVVEFTLYTTFKEDICLALCGNFLIIDWCNNTSASEPEFNRVHLRRRCLILPPLVSPGKVKARIVNQRLRIEVEQA